MGLPTLLRKGSLRPGMGESQDDLDKVKPIDYIVEWFRKKSSTAPKKLSDRFVVALSTTGTGKSTTLPAELYLRLFRDKNILVTQPRIVTAIDIPKTISKVPVYGELVMGHNIGYQTGDYVKKPLKKGILFTTVGVLLQQLKTLPPDAFARKYKVIILDEAHERSTELDLVFYYIKNLSRVVPLDAMPFVVCASGTMNIELYKKYFETDTVFIIQGDSYAIKNNFLEYDSNDLFSEMIKTLISINKSEGDRHKEDIVLFVPTNGMINKIKKAVLEAPALEGLLAIGLDSSAMKQVSTEYVNVFDDIDTLKGVKRKLIIGTNSIETGITLETISYCIDTGFVNSIEYNPVVRLNILAVKPVTQAMSMQRRGRVGRIQEGSFYPLYSEETFKEMQEIQYPAMITSELTIPLLNILCATPGIDIKGLDTMAKLPTISISNGLNKLFTLGLINRSKKPTELGLIVNKFRQLTIENILMLLADPGSIEVATIVCFLTVGRQGILSREFRSFDLPSKIKKVLSCEWLEFLVCFEKLLEVQLTSSMEDVKKYCKDNGFQYESVISFIELRSNIMTDVYNSAGFKFSKQGSSLLELVRMYEHTETDELRSRVHEFKEIFLESYRMNVCECVKQNTVKSIHTGVELYLPGTNVGDYIIYDSLIVKKNRAGGFSPYVVNGFSRLEGIAVDIPEMFA